MISQKQHLELCGCGCPRRKQDRAIVDGDVVYCNTACHMRNKEEAHGRKEALYHPHGTGFTFRALGERHPNVSRIIG